MKLSNTYAELPESFYRISKPSSFSDPKLLAFNKELAGQLGLDLQGETEESLAALFSGMKAWDGASFLSMAYAGHQFGNFVPQLGDGRAMLLGEVLDGEGRRYDLQLKGSGPTYFSRNGDGFSALGPVIREYLVSEAMHRLGVPTTRALAAVLTGDHVFREEASPGGVFTRVASSHLRVGTFEFFASRRDHQSLKILLDFAVDRHYPHLKGREDLAFEFLGEVIKAQVKLVTHWMSLGFIHGVMNTDNTSISGETIDYGPCAFMDHFRQDKVFSFIDRQGRYSYKNQRAIMMWNMTRLAECLIPLMGEDQEASVEKLNAELKGIPEPFDELLLKRMLAKLGLEPGESESDEALVSAFLEMMEKEKLDFTLSFRRLSELLEDEGRCDFYPETEAFQNFKKMWKTRLGSTPSQETLEAMNRVNPLYIARNHQVERVIQDAEDGDFKSFEELNTLLLQPYEKQAGMEAYEKPPLPEEEVLNTFCGT